MKELWLHYWDAYNIYTADGLDVLKQLGRHWSSLSDDEKASWNSRAKNLSSYSDQQKKRVICEIIAATDQNVCTICSSSVL